MLWHSGETIGSIEAQIGGCCLKSLERYIGYGCDPGGVMRAILENDLVGAFAAADARHEPTIRQLAAYIHAVVRGDCCGSREKVEAWIEHGGASGLESETTHPAHSDGGSSEEVVRQGGEAEKDLQALANELPAQLRLWAKELEHWPRLSEPRQACLSAVIYHLREAARVIEWLREIAASFEREAGGCKS